MNTLDKKVGRPRKESEPQKKRTLTLSDRHVEKARLIGGGKASEGVRVALDDFNIEEVVISNEINNKIR